jgi:hypothetical protein
VERERDQWQRPADIIRALDIRQSSVVADLRCGAGYFALKLAAAVRPPGEVLAVDIRLLPLLFLRVRAPAEPAKPAHHRRRTGQSAPPVRRAGCRAGRQHVPLAGDAIVRSDMPRSAGRRIVLDDCGAPAAALTVADAPPSAEGYYRPDRFDHSERAGALQEAVSRSEHAGTASAYPLCSACSGRAKR